MPQKLDSKVRAQLLLRRGTWTSLAADAEVSYSWVCKFAAGRIENPGYARLQRLQAAIRATRPALTRRKQEAAP